MNDDDIENFKDYSDSVGYAQTDKEYFESYLVSTNRIHISLLGQIRRALKVLYFDDKSYSDVEAAETWATYVIYNALDDEYAVLMGVGESIEEE